MLLSYSLSAIDPFRRFQLAAAILLWQ